MGLFDNMLKSDESLFLNDTALDYDFLPKLLPFRENEQHRVAECISPLFQGRNGKNVFIFGAPGIGKTAAMRFVLKELEEKTDDIIPIYINCWQKNTTHKIILAICEALDYKWVHNKKTDELFQIIKGIVNKKSAVFVFDEIDKVDDDSFLYMILEEIYKKCVFLITNYQEWLLELENRIKSRLIPESLQFTKYNAAETKSILKQRTEWAFVPGVWEEDAFELAAQRAIKLEDIRAGLYLLREAGNAAETKSSRKITKEHVQTALDNIGDFSIKKSEGLDDDMQFILTLIKNNSGKKIGDVFKIYQEEGGQSVYKTFQRKVRKLSDNKFINTKKIEGGTEGRTTILETNSMKKLTDF